MAHGLGVVAPPSLGGPVLFSAPGTEWAGPDPMGRIAYDVPLPLSVADGQPDLRLRYDGSLRSGVHGIGWYLDIPSIRRRTDLGVPFLSEPDAFVAPTGEPLIAGETREESAFRGYDLGRVFEVCRYHPRIESDFTRIERWRREDEDFWLLQTPDGTLHLFGQTDEARLVDPDVPAHIAEWRLQESLSAHGARALYTYRSEDAAGMDADGRDTRASRYLASVRYGNEEGSDRLLAWDARQPGPDLWHFELVVDYGERAEKEDAPPPYEPTLPWPVRQDPVCDTRYGFAHRTIRLCRQFLMFHRFSECGDVPVLVRRMRLDYDESPRHTLLRRIQWFAYDGNGRPQTRPGLDFDWVTFDASEGSDRLINDVSPLSRVAGAQLVDLYGDGVPGVLWQATTGWLYGEPIRGDDTADHVAYAPPKALPLPASNRPGTSLARFRGASPWSFAGIEPDGSLDWVVLIGSVAGRFSIRRDGTWSSFVPMSMPVDVDPDNGSWVDIDRTGRPALVQIDRHACRVYALDQAGEFSRCRIVPHHTDALPVVGQVGALADFGSLLAANAHDLFRIGRDGSVHAWPDLGSGRFGARLALGRLEISEQIDPSRMYAADVDGDGLTDLVYASRQGMLIFLNRSGHGFDAPRLRRWPDGMLFNDQWQLSVADVHGRGGMSVLVRMNSPTRGHERCWRIDLGEPFALRVRAVDNGRGACTTLSWRSSAQEWLDEKETADPPSERRRLPFAITLAKSIGTTDQIHRQTAWRTVAYRGSHYEPGERGFQGFGEMDTTYESDDPASMPDIRRREWFHQGVIAPPSSHAPPDRATRWNALGEKDDVLHDEPGHWRLALSGMLRHSETHTIGPDGTRLLDVQTRRYQVRLLGDVDRDRQYLPLLLEHIVEAHEDVDTSRRHTLFSAYDQWGALRRHIAIRCARGDGTPPDDAEAAVLWRDSYDEQQQVHHATETLTIPWHIHGTDRWRLDLPGDTRVQRWHVSPDWLPENAITAEWFESGKGFPPGMNSALVALTAVRYGSEHEIVPPDFAALPAAFAVAVMDREAQSEFTAVAGADTATRLIGVAGYELEQTRLGGADESLLYALTSRTTYAGLAERYRITATSPATSIGWTAYEYDAYGLFVVRSTDCLGWSVTLDHDYRRLAPWRSVDANGVIRSIAMDAFGAARAETWHGTERDASGKLIEAGFSPISGPDAFTSVPAVEAIADPVAALGEYARAWFPDEFAWQRADDPQPVHVVELTAGGQRPTTQVRIDVAHVDGMDRHLRSTHRVSAPDLTPWSVTSSSTLHPRGAVSYTELPHFAGDWRFMETNPSRPGERFRMDARGRLIECIRADGETRRRHYHAWYVHDEDENVCAERGGAADSVPSSPLICACDPSGRPVLQTRYLRNTFDAPGERQRVSAAYGVSGRLTSMCDARSSTTATPVRTWSAALGSVHSWSADEGDAWSFVSDTGQVIWTCDAMQVEQTLTRDVSGRWLERAVRAGNGTRVTAQARYALPAAAADGNNAAYSASVVFDTAGRLDTTKSSILGSPMETRRRLLDDDDLPDWSQSDAEGRLEATPTVAMTEYDRMGKIGERIDAAHHKRHYGYAEDGSLSCLRLTLDGGPSIDLATHIARDAAGRIVGMRLGDKLTRSWEFDEATRRVIASTTRDESGATIQHTRVAYDRVGNVLSAATAGRTTRHFRYDSLYRLVSATGFEHPGTRDQGELPPLVDPDAGSALARDYVRRYAYDANHNLSSYTHEVNGLPAREVHMTVAHLSNRSVPAATGATSDDVGTWFDASGRLLRLWPGDVSLQWSTEGHLHETSSVGATGSRDTLMHGLDGRCLRKRWQQGGVTGEARYDVDLDRYATPGASSEVVHLAVGRSRIHAITTDSGAAIMCELDDGNLLGSHIVGLSGTPVREEHYYPYGDVALRVAPAASDTSGTDRHFTGKERQGNGLYDFGLRHYAAWHARWIAPDPAADVDGLNRYAMVRANPVTFIDQAGLTLLPEGVDAAEKAFHARKDVQKGFDLFIDATADFVEGHKASKDWAALKSHIAISGYYFPPGEVNLPSGALNAFTAKKHTYTLPGDTGVSPGYGRTGYVNAQASVWDSRAKRSFPGMTQLTSGRAEGSVIAFHPGEQEAPGSPGGTLPEGATSSDEARQYYVSDLDAAMDGIANAIPRWQEAAAKTPARRPRPSTPPALHRNQESDLKAHFERHTAWKGEDGRYRVTPLFRTDGIASAHAETQATSAAGHTVPDTGHGPARAAVWTVRAGSLAPTVGADGKKAWDRATLKTDLREAAFAACYNCDGVLTGNPAVTTGAIPLLGSGRARLQHLTFAADHHPVDPGLNPLSRATSLRSGSGSDSQATSGNSSALSSLLSPASGRSGLVSPSSLHAIPEVPARRLPWAIDSGSRTPTDRWLPEWRSRTGSPERINRAFDHLPHRHDGNEFRSLYVIRALDAVRSVEARTGSRFSPGRFFRE